jgi:hypothetical protein
MKVDVDNILQDQEVTILGGGPSLQGFDYGILRPPVVSCAVCSFYAGILDRTVLVTTLDQLWYEKPPHDKWVKKFKGVKVSMSPPYAEGYGWLTCELDEENNKMDWLARETNLNGFFSIYLALHLGAKRLFLLGFDGGWQYRNQLEWYSTEASVPEGWGWNSMYKKNPVFDVFNTAYPDREVINVGEYSRIEAFRKVPLNENFYNFN